MKIKSLLKEILLFEISLDQIKTQFVDTGKLKPNDFNSIVDASGGDSAYATWLTARVVGSKLQRPIIKPEDIYKYKKYLATFKSRRREFPFTDINQIKSPQDLTKFITTAVNLKNQEEEDPSKAKGLSKADKYSKLKIGEIDDFTVYKIPKSATKLKQVACDLGSGTEWCTSHSEANHFSEYIKDGPLYIFGNNRGEKYQFHYESDEFRDKNNDEVDITNPQILKFFKYLKKIGERKIPLDVKISNPTVFKLTLKDFKEKNITLRHTQIKSLPDGLSVDGDLDLMDTPIKSLPDGLSVGGDLDLRWTEIKSLPDDLSVGGDLFLKETPFSEKFSLSKARAKRKIMAKYDIGGSVYM